MNIHESFIEACKSGDLEKVKYLLMSPELTEHADIHFRKDGGLRIACFNGHAEVVKFLVSSEEITDRINVLDFNKWVLTTFADNEAIAWVRDWVKKHEAPFQKKFGL